MSINDAEYQALGAQAYTGTLPERELAWLLDNGASTRILPQAWREFLDAQGYTTGIWNVDVMAWLGDLGYTGTLNERLLQFWIDGGVVGGADDPVWLAATYDASLDTPTYELKAQVIGEGSPTFTNSELLLPDHEGVYKTIPANSPTWHGARVVTNYCSHSTPSDSASGFWTYFGYTRVGITTIDGVECTEVSADNTDPSGAVAYNISGAALTERMITRVLIRGKIAGQFCRLKLSGNVFSSDIEIPMTWTWLSFAGDVTSGGNGAGVRNPLTNITTPLEYYIAAFQIEYADGRTDIVNPSEYVASTGGNVLSAYYANLNGNTVNPTTRVVTEAVGTPLTEAPSLYAAPALTNLVTYSRDLTNAYWAASNSTVTYDEVGITGEPNTAGKLVATADGSLRGVKTPSNGLSVASGTSTIRVMLKTENSDWAQLRAGQFDTTCQVWYNTATSSVGTVVGATDTDIEVINGWTVCYLQFSTTTDLLGRIDIYASEADNTNQADAGHTVIVGNVELFSGKTIAQVKGSSPIVTEGSTVTTSAVQIEYDIANHDNAQGAYYIETSRWADSQSNSTTPLQIAGGIGLIHRTSFQGVRAAYSGGTITINSQHPSDVFVKTGVAYEQGTGDIGLKVRESAFSEATNYATWSASPTGPNLLRSREQPLLIRNAQRWDLNYTDAKAKIDELMT